jgi:Ca2+-binding EF-hand superfamily protein
MITATSELLGKPCELQNAKSLAKKILDFCDKKRNGKITREEFVNG